LGKSAFDLGRAIYQSVREQLVTLAKPYIDELRDSLGIDVALEVLFDEGRSWLTGMGAAAFSGPIYDWRQNSCPRRSRSKGDHVLFPSRICGSSFKRKNRSVNPKTITDPKVLRRNYLNSGVGGRYDLGESDMDFHIVAAPVLTMKETCSSCGDRRFRPQDKRSV